MAGRQDVPVPVLETTRLFLHVLAATVWVGGQLTLAALVPALRPLGAEVTSVAARQFRRVAWPAFAVLLVTGVWNVAALSPPERGRTVTLAVKLVAVIVSGLAAFAHERARSRRGLVVWGAVAGVSALVALLYGVILAEGVE
jgi:putative copper export protein